MANLLTHNTLPVRLLHLAVHERKNRVVVIERPLPLPPHTLPLEQSQLAELLFEGRLLELEFWRKLLAVDWPS